MRVKGWDDIGYHFLIDADGATHVGRDIERAGAHCVGRNSNSIGIAYVGGLHYDAGTPMDTRTTPQRNALIRLVLTMMKRYDLQITDIHCHNEFSTKACPCFTIESFRDEIRAHM